MRPARSAGPWRRRGEARRGITRLTGRTAPEGRGYRAEVADLAPQRRGALQGPRSSRPVRRQGRGASARTGGGPRVGCRKVPGRRVVPDRLSGPSPRALPRWVHRSSRASLRQPPDGHSAPRGSPHGLPGQAALSGARDRRGGGVGRTGIQNGCTRIVPGTAKPGLAGPALRRVRTASPLP